MVAQLHAAAEVVFDHRIERIHGRLDRALSGVAEERGGVDIQRAPAQRRHAAVSHPFVVEALVGQAQAGAGAKVDAEGRVDAVALQLEAVAETPGVFVEGVDAEAGVAFAIADAGADVQRAALAVTGAELHGASAMVSAVGLAGDAVDHATAAATAEDHRIRAFQRFDAFHVVGVADVLHVIAHAIDEEIRGRAVAAHDRSVAVAFALGDADAGHVAQGIGEAGHRLVGDQLVGDHGHCLRHVEQGGIGFRRAARLACAVVGQVALADHGDAVQIPGLILCHHTIIGGNGGQGQRGQQRDGQRGVHQGARIGEGRVH